MRARAVVAVVFAVALGAAGACASFGSGDTEASDGATPEASLPDDAGDERAQAPDASRSPCQGAVHVLCDDFDQTLTTMGLTENLFDDAGGKVGIDLVDSDASPPHAVHFTQAPVMVVDAGSCTTIATIGTPYNMPVRLTGTVRVALDLRVHASADEITIVLLDFSAMHYQIAVRLAAGTIYTTQYRAGGTPQSFHTSPNHVPVPTDAWTHLLLSVDLVMHTVSLATSDVAQPPNEPFVVGPPPPSNDVQTTFFVGFPCTQSASGSVDVDMDDVVLDSP